MTVLAEAVDLSTAEFWTNNPFPTLSELRERSPFWHTAGEGHPFWAVLKHADVLRVSRDPITFASGQGVTLYDAPVQNTILETDNPRHKWMRRLVSRGFTPRQIKELEPHVRQICIQILDEIGNSRECDFVADLAAPLPVTVISEMLGVPIEDRKLLRRWSSAITEYRPGSEEYESAAGEIFSYLGQMQESRRGDRTDDLISLLMDAELEGDSLPPEIQRGFFFTLVFAGQETTTSCLSEGLLALLRHPDQLETLSADLGLIPNAVEEICRWSSPIIRFRRTAVTNAVVGGRDIAEGDWVVMFYPSANRDPDVFVNPEQFDVSRTPNEHVAFGAGNHFCLGASLARLEMRVFLEEMLQRYPTPQLCGHAPRVASSIVHGPAVLPIRLW